MKKMKSVMFILIACFALVGCGEKEDDVQNVKKATQEEKEALEELVAHEQYEKKKNEMLEKGSALDARYSELMDSIPALFSDYYQKCCDGDYDTYHDMVAAIIENENLPGMLMMHTGDPKTGVRKALALFEYAYEKGIKYDIEGFDDACKFSHSMYEYNEEYEALIDEASEYTGEYIFKNKIVDSIEDFEAVWIEEWY